MKANLFIKSCKNYEESGQKSKCFRCCSFSSHCVMCMNHTLKKNNLLKSCDFSCNFLKISNFTDWTYWNF